MNEFEENSSEFQIGAMLGMLFGPVDDDYTRVAVLGSGFFAEHMRPIGLMACRVVDEWVTKYEGTFSDPEKAAQKVVSVFLAETRKKWNKKYMPAVCSFFNVSSISVKLDDDVEQLTAGQAKAIAKSQKFASDYISSNYKWLEFVQNIVAEKKWAGRPQEELIYRLGGLYLKRLALMSHALANLILNSDSQWHQYYEEALGDGAVVVDENHRAGTLADLGYYVTPEQQAAQAGNSKRVLKHLVDYTRAVMP